jgi:hypothetical protein
MLMTTRQIQRLDVLDYVTALHTWLYTRYDNGV